MHTAVHFAHTPIGIKPLPFFDTHQQSFPKTIAFPSRKKLRGIDCSVTEPHLCDTSSSHARVPPSSLHRHFSGPSSSHAYNGTSRAIMSDEVATGREAPREVPTPLRSSKGKEVKQACRFFNSRSGMFMFHYQIKS